MQAEGASHTWDPGRRPAWGALAGLDRGNRAPVPEQLSGCGWLQKPLQKSRAFPRNTCAGRAQVGTRPACLPWRGTPVSGPSSAHPAAHAAWSAVGRPVPTGAGRRST
jgi:hypothetical protein